MLAALLRQNPRFETGISTPLAPMCNSLLKVMGARSEHATQFTKVQKKAVLKGLFENYYGEIAEGRVVFDTNRSWCARLGMLKLLFPEARIICCVRNIAWVMDSFERLVQSHPLVYSRLFNDDGERGTVYSRTTTLMHKNRVVGYAMAALKEAFYGKHSNSLLLIDYELLCRRPQRCMELIYDFLEEDPYQHNTERVCFDSAAFDVQLGLPGMHRVEEKVTFKERRTLLPPDIFSKYHAMSFWENPEGSLASIISVSKQDR